MMDGAKLALLAIIYSAVAIVGAVLGLPRPVVFVFAGAAIFARLVAMKRGV